MKIIPYGRQDISQSDIDAVAEVLRSDWLTQGPAVAQFESAIAAYCGVANAVSFCNATAGLHAACSALGLGPGDLLWTSPNTFVASANCARYCGADVDFVDIDPNTWNMCALALHEKLQDARRRGRLPKIVVPVHFGGNPCDMQRISELAKEYGFAVIEDASHAIGAKYQGSNIGDCRYSDVTVFSLHPVKIITTGEGGLAMCRDLATADRLRRFRSHGITRQPELMKQNPGDWYYEQTEIGYNFRLTDIQCALGTAQLSRLACFLRRRRELATSYSRALAHLALQLPQLTKSAESAWHLYVVLLPDSVQRKTVFDALRAQGILVNVHYIPVHLQPYYQRLGFGPGMFPRSENYYSRAITLPLFPALTDEQQGQIVAALERAMA